MRLWCRMGDVAVDLRRHDLGRQERKRRRRYVARLTLQPRPVDRATVEAWRGAGLQTPQREAETRQGLGHADCRRFADTAGGDALFADVDEAPQKCAGRQDDAASRHHLAVGQDDAGDPAGGVARQILDAGGAQS